MAFFEAGFGGSVGGNLRLRVTADVIGQEVSNNRSLIRYNAWIERVGTANVYNFDPTYGNTNINGYNPGRSLGGYDFRYNVRYNLAVNEDYWINHDANGNASPYFGANYNLNNSPFATSAATGGNVALPTINRYISITGYSLSAVTEKSINVNVSTSGTASAVDYSLNGGGWTRGFTGNFTSNTFTINGLNPATLYNIRIRVQNASGGLFTESGVQAATTLAVVITSLTIPSKTDVSATIQATTNYVADLLQFRLQGTSPWTEVAGAFTTTTGAITGLTADSTYVYEARARHQDSQQFTPIKTVTFSTGLPQPLQATQLQPGGGKATSSLLPTFYWQYNATSPDVQSAYQVLLQRVSDASTVWDSGQVLTSTTNATLPGGITLLYNVQYQWAVKTWSGSGIAGIYSSLTTFKVSQAPVVVITAPTTGSTIATDIPTITWTYSDPEATPQSAYRIIISESGIGVFDKTVTNSAATSFNVPLRVLQNNHTYDIVVEAFDGDGIKGTSASVSVLLSYIAPPIPTITVETSDNKVFALINVGTTQPANESWGTDSINVYKRELGAVEWNFLANVAATPQYIAEMSNTDSWTVSGTGGAVQDYATSRQGGWSTSLYNTGAGSSKMERTENVGTIIQNDRQRAWVRINNDPALTEINFSFGTDNANYFKYKIRYSYPVQTISTVFSGSNSMTTSGFHNLLTGHKVTFSTTGVMPAPLVAGTAYYIRFNTTSNFYLHRTANDALNNTNQIDLTSVGSGTLTVTPEQILTNNTWNSIEMDNRAFEIVGSPSLTNIQWRQAEIVTSAAVVTGDILFDAWHIVPSKDSMFVYDYELANNKTYQYAASSLNNEQLLESGYSVASQPVVIQYPQLLNTYLIPTTIPSSAIQAFMDISDLPSMTTQTATEYHQPLNARYPVVYTSGIQKYRTGSFTVQFFDECFNGAGMDGVKAFEVIMNEKPMMIRTYWGEIYYVSIDGSLNIDRIKDVGWSASFSFTEQPYDRE